jgi:hypothetical protein
MKESRSMENRFGRRSLQRLVPSRIAKLALVLFALFVSMPLATGHAAADGGTLYVHVHACGSFSGIPPTDYALLSSACVQTPYYNGFWITTEGYTYKGLPSNNNLDWTWNGVPSHIFQIQGQVDLNNSTPVVYCQNGTQDHAELMQATSGYNGGYVHPTMAGGYVVCDWFAIADGPENTGTISIDVFTCPGDFDTANAGMNDFYQACKERENGATFAAKSSLNVLDPLTTGDNAVGNVFWPYVTADAIQITETPAAGYQTARVYCRSKVTSPGYAEYPGDGGKITWNLSAGERFECDWYDAPAAGGAIQNVVYPGEANGNGGDGGSGDNGDNSGDQNADNADDGGSGDSSLDLNDQSTWTGRVEITVRVCPADFDPSAGDFDGSCWDDGNGIGFAIFSADQWWPETSGDYAPQMVIWDPVPQQDVVIKEDVPNGFATPIVFCGDGEQIGVNDDGSIDVTIHDHETLTCTFFNVQS